MDALITADEAMKVVIFNFAAEQIFGCTAAEWLGSPIESFIPGIGGFDDGRLQRIPRGRIRGARRIDLMQV